MTASSHKYCKHAPVLVDEGLICFHDNRLFSKSVNKMSVSTHTKHKGLFLCRLAHTLLFGFLCKNPAVSQSENQVTSEPLWCPAPNPLVSSLQWIFIRMLNVTGRDYRMILHKNRDPSLRFIQWSHASFVMRCGKFSSNTLSCFITDLHISGGRINTVTLNTKAVSHLSVCDHRIKHTK